MPKPKWLKDIDNGVEKQKFEPKRCGDCEYFAGSPIKEVKYKGKERVMLWECMKHPDCYNTKYSVRCSDWKRMMI